MDLAALNEPEELANLELALAGERGVDQQRIALVVLGWADLLLRKNADYGSSAWQVPVSPW